MRAPSTRCCARWHPEAPAPPPLRKTMRPCCAPIASRTGGRPKWRSRDAGPWHRSCPPITGPCKVGSLTSKPILPARNGAASIRPTRSSSHHAAILTGETLAMTRPSGLGLLALIALALVGRWMAPSLDSAVRLQLASDDPAGMSDVLIGRTLTSARAASEIDAALAAGDPDLADSFVALADRHGIAVDPERRVSVAAAEQGSVLGTAASFARGAVIGDEGGAS